MNLIDDSSNVDSTPVTIQPEKLTEAARSKSGRPIPPSIVLRIFQYLPVPDLATVAMCSRRFKVLANDDEIWDDKLELMLKNDTGALAAALGMCRDMWTSFNGDTYPIILDGTNAKGSLIDSENTIFINNKPLSALIPGISTDPYNTRARVKSTGDSKELFRQIYTQLLPYYVDLRGGNKESTKILHDFGNQPEECGRVLNLMVGFSDCHVFADWKQVGYTIYIYSY
jgi:recyclin-1